MTPLHHIGNAIRDLLLHVPLWAVRGLFLATFVVLLLWVLLLPRHVVAPPDGTRRWDANLRYVAAAALLLQIIIYLLF